MTQASVGSAITAASLNTFSFSGSNTDNKWYSGTYSTGEAVYRMVNILCYFAGDTGSTTGGPCWWGDNSTGTTLLQYTARTVSQGSHSPQGGFDIQTSMDVPEASTTLRFGGFRNGTGSSVMPYKTGASNFKTVSLSGSSPGSATGGVTFGTEFGSDGSMRAYGTYFIVQFYVRRGGVWQKVVLNLKRSSTWVSPQPQVFVRRGGAWTQIAKLVETGELDWAKEQKIMIVYEDLDFEEGILRWDYDDPRYVGSGWPGDPDWKEYEEVLKPAGPYELVTV
jgi:hypothetical protein